MEMKLFNEKEDKHVIMPSQCCILLITNGDNAEIPFNISLYNYQINEYAIIHLSNGQTLTTTVNHHIFVKNKNDYCCIESSDKYPQPLTVDCNNDDKSKSSKGVFILNIDIQFIHSNQTPLLPKVFASLNKNMFANGVLVHNGSEPDQKTTVTIESAIIKVKALEFPLCVECQYNELMNCSRVIRGIYKCSLPESVVYQWHILCEACGKETLKFDEMDNFSIPLTLQYYKVTSNGVVTEIKAQLDNSQNQADFIGSL
ncbi:hypothetical protein RFI_35660, partial [Reticulomyxa filosa]